MMRGEVVDRIRELEDIHANFDPGFMRWRWVRFQDKLLRDVEYDILTDKDLLEFYTIIVKQCAKQM